MTRPDLAGGRGYADRNLRVAAAWTTLSWVACVGIAANIFHSFIVWCPSKNGTILANQRTFLPLMLAVWALPMRRRPWRSTAPATTSATAPRRAPLWTLRALRLHLLLRSIMRLGLTVMMRMGPAPGLTPWVTALRIRRHHCLTSADLRTILLELVSSSWIPAHFAVRSPLLESFEIRDFPDLSNYIRFIPFLFTLELSTREKIFIINCLPWQMTFLCKKDLQSCNISEFCNRAVFSLIAEGIVCSGSPVFWALPRR